MYNYVHREAIPDKQYKTDFICHVLYLKLSGILPLKLQCYFIKNFMISAKSNLPIASENSNYVVRVE
ncbi:hypothetical protein GCM10007380_40400 [Gottfriedia solisilvae]|uniref:Uncharacterized protein n=1 Tax=Gottfriedia solisilvae TaxID=1516104 RepID=A0A8J3F5I2_9BACI|nr:hypothetical protein GCM10007380_40400 [Gottfriedia solisilvae]